MPASNTLEDLSIDDAEDANNVTDESESDESPAPVRYSITSYGADPDVDGLVKRLRRNEIFVPPFQREYIWNLKEASRFIESLLLGLPVPGVFLAKDDDTNKLLVIDGQQRLKTLQFFYDGVFNHKEGEGTQKIFKLLDVQPHLEGLTYKTLPEKDRIDLDNAIIHATIVKQDSPADDDTSIYHIFERLNSGGRRLTHQEIRTATYHGELINLIKRLNNLPEWRTIYGKPSPRLKDQELILRFFALLHWSDRYERPMSEFLSKFTAKHRHIDEQTQEHWAHTFTSVVHVLFSTLAGDAFRPERSLNAAVFDSIMVGLARRLQTSPIEPLELKAAYHLVLVNPPYQHATTRATADKNNVEARLGAATTAFTKKG